MRKWIWKMAVTIVAVAIMVAILYVNYHRSLEIENFSDCVGAGYPVSQTYPLQCVAHGKTFVKVGSDPVETAVENVVTNFGGVMQLVSTSAPTATAAQAIKDNYRDLVSASLLATWMSDPADAPGRPVSSPWPDHVAITSIAQVGTTTYSVAGSVIEHASGGSIAAGQYAIETTVDIEGGNWVISSWNGQQPR
jgi:hypothetical protein